VSCASVGNCSAVGTYRDSSGATEGLLLAETDGIWMKGVEAVLPANASKEVLSLGRVSCASVGNCTAAGGYSVGPYDWEGLLLNETDGTWATGVEAQLPSNAGGTRQLVGLDSVSCPSAGKCNAVGSYLDSSTGGSQEGLLLGGSPPKIKLHVSKNG